MQFEQLGPYRLSRKLGQGGMGSVYEGVDTNSGEPAAVKVLSPHLASEEGFRARFVAEIDSLKKLRHPNIVRLFGYGEQAGTLFYAMELVDGTSLEDELRAGRRFPWRDVTEISIKLCRALKHAHDHGIIHRDIKPANLLLANTGEVKLSDFGIARLFGNTRMTSDGGVLGTAEYMAPEQADGRPVTDRCDQYSLGGVMYALLAGRPPFRASSLVEMLQLQRFAQPEPVRRFAPETPDELERIVMQLLEKEPHKRFANVMLLGRGLEAMTHGLSVSIGRTEVDRLAEGESAAQSATFDPASPTLVPEQLDEDEDPEAFEPFQSATEATIAEVQSPGEKSTVIGDSGARRFTKVEPQKDEAVSWRREFLAAMSPTTLGLAAALIIVGLAVWYVLRPATADQLYEAIAAHAAAGSPEKLREAEHEISEFLLKFPDDPRAATVQSYHDEIALARSERKSHRTVPGLRRPAPSSPVERAYLEALALSQTDPTSAAVKLRAIVDVYGEKQGNRDVQHYVELAARELKRLDERLERFAAEDAAAIHEHLERARRLESTDPAAAKKIWRGIVELYGDKPWAQKEVQTARDRLAQAQSADEKPATQQASSK